MRYQYIVQCDVSSSALSNAKKKLGKRFELVSSFMLQDEFKKVQYEIDSDKGEVKLSSLSSPSSFELVFDKTWVVYRSVAKKKEFKIAQPTEEKTVFYKPEGELSGNAFVADYEGLKIRAEVSYSSAEIPVDARAPFALAMGCAFSRVNFKKFPSRIDFFADGDRTPFSRMVFGPLERSHGLVPAGSVPANYEPFVATEEFKKQKAKVRISSKTKFGSKALFKAAAASIFKKAQKAFKANVPGTNATGAASARKPPRHTTSAIRTAVSVDQRALDDLKILLNSIIGPFSNHVGDPANNALAISFLGAMRRVLNGTDGPAPAGIYHLLRGDSTLLGPGPKLGLLDSGIDSDLTSRLSGLNETDQFFEFFMGRVIPHVNDPSYSVTPASLRTSILRIIRNSTISGANRYMSLTEEEREFMRTHFFDINIDFPGGASRRKVIDGGGWLSASFFMSSSSIDLGPELIKTLDFDPAMQGIRLLAAPASLKIDGMMKIESEIITVVGVATVLVAGALCVLFPIGCLVAILVAVEVIQTVNQERNVSVEADKFTIQIDIKYGASEFLNVLKPTCQVKVIDSNLDVDLDWATNFLSGIFTLGHLRFATDVVVALFADFEGMLIKNIEDSISLGLNSQFKSWEFQRFFKYFVMFPTAPSGVGVDEGVVGSAISSKATGITDPNAFTAAVNAEQARLRTLSLQARLDELKVNGIGASAQDFDYNWAISPDAIAESTATTINIDRILTAIMPPKNGYAQTDIVLPAGKTILTWPVDEKIKDKLVRASYYAGYGQPHQMASVAHSINYINLRLGELFKKDTFLFHGVQTANPKFSGLGQLIPDSLRTGPLRINQSTVFALKCSQPPVARLTNAGKIQVSFPDLEFSFQPPSPASAPVNRIRFAAEILAYPGYGAMERNLGQKLVLFPAFAFNALNLCFDFSTFSPHNYILPRFPGNQPVYVPPDLAPWIPFIGGVAALSLRVDRGLEISNLPTRMAANPWSQSYNIMLSNLDPSKWSTNTMALYFQVDSFVDPVLGYLVSHYALRFQGSNLLVDFNSMMQNMGFEQIITELLGMMKEDMARIARELILS